MRRHPLELQIKVATAAAKRKRRPKKGAKKAAKRTSPRGAGGLQPAKPVEETRRQPGAATDRLEEALRNWRLAEAKRRGIPAFRICTDAALKAMADRRPSTAAELLGIPGIGISTVEKYGAQIYRLVAQSGSRG